MRPEFYVVNLVRLGALVPKYVIDDGEFLRILTSMFLHAYYSFVMNMVALYILGILMERLLWPLNYFILYLVSGLAGARS